MKKIMFLRHAKLAVPFNDYNKLTFAQICQLGMADIDPSINKKGSAKQMNNLKKSLAKTEVIYRSSSLRSEQTAELIKNFLNRNIPILENKNLNEIYFNLSLLMTREEFIKNRMLAIRKSIFRGMRSGQGVESLERVIGKIRDLEKQLMASKNQYILCITHSFFMRVLRVYFLEDMVDSRRISELKLMNTIDHHYLEGFEVYLW